MIIVYRFADGTKTEVEVDDELGIAILEEERKFENYERKCRYWCPIKLDQSEYEGDWFADDNTPSKAYELEEEQKRVDAFMETLTPTQRRRLEIRMDNPGISLREIARQEGTDIKTIRECFEGIEKKYKNFFKNYPPQKC